MATFGPYSPVYQAGEFYFISGQVGIDPITKQADKSIQAQAEQVLKNIQGVLDSVGLNLDSIVKTTIFLKDIDDYQVVNEIYMKHFAEPRPARSCVAVSALPKVGDHALLIEIEAVAMKERK